MSKVISFGLFNGNQLLLINTGLPNNYEFVVRKPGTVGRDGLLCAELPFDMSYAVRSWRRNITSEDYGDRIHAQYMLLIYRMAKRRNISFTPLNLPKGKSRTMSVEFFGITSENIEAKRAELGI